MFVQKVAQQIFTYKMAFLKIVAKGVKYLGYFKTKNCHQYIQN